MYHGEVIFETGDNKQVIYTRNKYNIVKNVSWKDVKLKVSDEIKQNSGIVINGDKYSFICHNDHLPGTLKSAYQEVGLEDMHIYISFSGNAETFGRHNDTDDVVLVQSIGKMTYRFDNGKMCLLSPGDSLFIPEGVYHDPIVHEPRVTLSFSLSH
jgi:mannose-6-phosphate isomerase-like protein (cupin superfamily)